MKLTSLVWKLPSLYFLSSSLPLSFSPLFCLLKQFLTLFLQTEEYNYELSESTSPRYDASMSEERPLASSRDYSLELEMATDDTDAAPASPGFSSTMPSNPSPSAFGGSTFGTGTFSGTRPSVKRRDSREVKAFGAHRGVPTPGTHSLLILS